MTSVNQIRSEFLEYFQKHDHTVVPASPLVPRNDPTLMFVNSGMVQFKDVFTGKEKRDYTTATSAQKSVRAGGKHNDLDNVGYTARHHTFFEMLGNFSFGAYFKEAAIEHAWNVLTKVFKLPKEKLLVTVYHEDDEAASLWKKIAGFSDDRIIRIRTNDNFWYMADTGPCGPSSEIFYDHGENIPGGPPGSKDEDGDRFIEIWNLVFMQYDQITKEKHAKLPKPCVDTGMGLERLAAVLQGKHNNYDIDLMRALIESSAEISGTEPDGKHQFSHRVIADHLRSTSFLIADGVMPSNEGRGYVLRRIMRRAMRHAHMMGCKTPLIYRLVPTLIEQMGGHYNELVRAEATITETLKSEEVRFKETLEKGLKILDEAIGKISSKGILPGDVAFKLYDTYGFPLDLTADILRGKNLHVDTAGFDAAMDKQRVEARKAWSGSGEKATDQIWFELKEHIPSTEFLGYHVTEAEGLVLALLNKDAKPVNEFKSGEEGYLIANQTPFYGESGGQIGDHGIIQTDNGALFEVTDTHKKLGLHIHYGKLSKGTLKINEAARFQVDLKRRGNIAAHHSGTHLLHKALQDTLGKHVTQKGSLVTADYLRFDFSHPKALSPQELQKIEHQVHAEVRKNTDTMTKLMGTEEAMKEGAMALFGEKYDKEVRVIRIGTSLELCGGTHVKRTGDIGFFKIISESAVSSGVRRIEAVASEAAEIYVESQNQIIQTLMEETKASAPDLTDRVHHLIEDRKRLEKEVETLRKKAALGGGASHGKPDVQKIGKIEFIGKTFHDIPAKDLKGMADELKSHISSGVVALLTSHDGKASIVVTVTENLSSSLNAVDLVSAAIQVLGGQKGGGRPDMAQGGGPEVGKIQAALEIIEKNLRKGFPNGQ